MRVAVALPSPIASPRGVVQFADSEANTVHALSFVAVIVVILSTRVAMVASGARSDAISFAQRLRDATRHACSTQR